MPFIFVNTTKSVDGKWGWCALLSSHSHHTREYTGIASGSLLEAQISGLIAGLHALVSATVEQGVEVILAQDPALPLINLGSSRWSNLQWRREAGIDSAESLLWRKLAKASRRFELNARKASSMKEFELLGRAEYFSQCALDHTRLVKLFTDGSFVPKLKSGGWVAILEDGKTSREMSGPFACLDCNEAELYAVNQGLASLSDKESAIVFTDSLFVVSGAQTLELWRSNNWRSHQRRKISHRKHWEELYQHMQRLSVRFEWIKGHSGIEQNFRADALAKREAFNAKI